MNDHVISVDNLSKKFRLHTTGTRTLKSAVLDVLSVGRGKREDFWALKDINFSVKKGETLGIIGVNGAGKSTLLSLLAGTKEPTQGSINTVGTISSLLELGAGFHPDLTGRENVFLCGAVMGIPKQQMKERFDAIVDFAGIEEFIDQPVKHYSSGMYIRLGFAVAVEVDPDILLIDEVLAVGDVGFQRKCLQKMDEFKKQQKTMLIISHDLGTIQSVSDRILILDDGKVTGLGDPNQMLSSYQSLSRSKVKTGLEREWGSGEVKITGVEIHDSDGNESETFKYGESLKVVIKYNAQEEITDPVFGFSISDDSGRLVYGNNTQIDKFTINKIKGEGSIELNVEKLTMSSGTYLFSFSIHSSDHKSNYHRLDKCLPFSIECDKQFEGLCYFPVSWSNK